ncbi:MFS transporter [Streptomyces sp. NBC_00425]
METTGPALLVCLAAGATTLIDRAVLNIAVPSMRQSIAATGADVQWIVGRVLAGLRPRSRPRGGLGDLHGRKRLFMAGMAVFLLAGVTAATGGGPGTLIGARLVLGAAAGLVNSQVRGQAWAATVRRRRILRAGQPLGAATNRASRVADGRGATMHVFLACGSPPERPRSSLCPQCKTCPGSY